MIPGSYISSMYYLPMDGLGSTVAQVKKDLTVIPNTYTHGVGYGPGDPIDTFDTEVPGYIGVPISWGLERYGEPERYDVASGVPLEAVKIPDSNHASVDDPKEQKRFMENMYAHLIPHGQLLAKAPTGSGKTVCALWVAAKLGVSTLVIAPNVSVADQWILEIKDKLGLADNQIGIMRGRKNKTEGKLIVVGILKSMASIDYPEEFYNQWGFVIWDEAHKMGARQFSQSLSKFPAKYKLAITADAKRKDGTLRIITDTFGNIGVHSQAKALPCELMTLDYYLHAPFPEWWGPTQKRQALSRDRNRNIKISTLISKMYDDGYFILVVSDYTKQLVELLELLLKDNVPEDTIGMYIGKYSIGKGKNKKSIVATSEYLEAVRSDEKFTIVLATYGMIKEAVNISRLDRGVDASPRSDGLQMVGRLRRKYKGKGTPRWYTIKDIGDSTLENSYISRVRDIKSSGNIREI